MRFKNIHNQSFEFFSDCSCYGIWAKFLFELSFFVPVHLVVWMKSQFYLATVLKMMKYRYSFGLNLGPQTP
jgi:hypothetical protein